MGSSLSIIEMDDDSDGVLMELLENEDYDYQEHLVNVLQRMVSRGTLARYCSMKMPVIRKRPDLSVFRNTDLYKEIKYLSGHAPDSEPPSDQWSLQKILQDRENGIGRKPAGTLSENQYRKIANQYIPNKKSQRLMSLESKVFCGTFNKSGSRLITASQDHVIRVFDSSKGTYHRVNRIQAVNVSWCILDVDISPDEEYFVYSTWSEYLHVCRVDERTDNIQWLQLNPEHSRSCVFSVRFSPCGNYILGGANDACMYIYDRTTNARTTKIKVTNTDEFVDINAVCYVDNNLFVSGCDDGIIKLWDSRCLADGAEPAQIFVGHFDGITYIDSRNDGNYILSNSKDQSIKIWDLRRASPMDKEQSVRNEFIYNWDYRWDNVPRDFYNPQKTMDGDSSVMTFRGHRVTKSLIRAKFSPMEQTGQRYIYTGCGSGRVIIYDVLTGHIKEAIEGHKDIVRDAAWHPVRSEIISSSWDTHVNLSTYNRTISQKRRNSLDRQDEEQQPLRRSRRIAMQRNNVVD
ncbi:DDB1- and CUL4-associated factor 11 [Hermetia illucens]|nr:DDB1- and CUL4-associated factor 11 [Hermetia illucens]XP_037926643.1 DDB1- and CUL4-associated factor 11 [Hermetia illucens]